MRESIRFTTEAKYLIKIFESNLGNDQPQRGFDEMMREKHSKGPNMTTDPFKQNKNKNKHKTCFCVEETVNVVQKLFRVA